MLPVLAGPGVEQGPQRPALHLLGDGGLGVVEARGGQVHVRDEGVAAGAGGDARPGHDHGDPPGGLVRKPLAPVVVVAEHLAVVAGVDDDRVVQFAALFEPLLVEPDPAVDVLDHRRVVLADADVVLRRERGRRRKHLSAAGDAVVVVRLREVLDHPVRPAVLALHPLGDVHRRVGPVEVDDQEPGAAVRHAVEQFHSGTSGVVVLVGVVADRGRVRHPPPVDVPGLPPRLDVRVVDGLQRRIERIEPKPVGLAVSAALAAGDQHVGEAPLLHVQLAVGAPAGGTLVEVDLAAGHRVVAAVVEVLVEGRAERGVVLVAVPRHGAVLVLHAGGQARPRRAADRRRHDRPGEVGAARRQRVQVRRRNRDVGVPPHPVVPVLVRDEEQDVRPPDRARARDLGVAAARKGGRCRRGAGDEDLASGEKVVARGHGNSLPGRCGRSILVGSSYNVSSRRSCLAEVRRRCWRQAA